MKGHTQFERTSGANDSVWVHNSPYSDRPHFDALSEDIKTQTCIIGAGIAGLSTAYELVCRQQDVVLLEARDAISGETGRTSGHLASALDDGYTRIAKKHGLKGAQAAADSHGWAIKRVGQIARKLGIDCDYREIPAYRVSQFDRFTQPKEHAEDVKELRDEADMAAKLNLNAEFREGLAVRGWKGKYDQRDALVVEGQARFHPTKYLNGLMAWLKKQDSFRCYTGTRVMLVEEKGVEILGHGNKEVHIQTEMGYHVQCQNAVEATCVPLQKLSVIAEMEFDRTYCLALRVPKDSVEDCLLYDTADPYIYVRLVECDDKFDYLVVGGGDHKVGQEDTIPRFQELEDWARERFPQCITVDYRWSGQIFEPVDYMAFIGKNQGCDHTYIVTGDSGNGLTHGVLAGRLLADEIAPQPAEQDEIDQLDKNVYSPDWAAVADVYSPKRVGSILRSAPTMLAHDLQINMQYKRFLQSDINDIEDLAPGTGGVLNPKAKMPMAVFRDEEGNMTKMSALCPHMKGVVCWNQAEKSFDCPVHGSRFSPMGLCLNGPAKGNLEPAERQVSGSFEGTIAAAKGSPS
ncbi:Rieske 2Fe-2S iron-sulfur protein YhfW [Diaporthe amygdali]|uniref:Rieske 2Fe-2S iron-sulfur protein YhfW n=1 Tax=Phomopsis amygdali TaxID=1214568 RepID=UPI0022FEF462|nr:Rieske 2Fe-2S iron-sulfur protein YhfW [Diaporthe amygdali]KAJ0116938.1 Rieske 2Fe-2S iron-sulfur protein YhfW [Diaporthe amygdali]